MRARSSAHNQDKHRNENKQQQKTLNEIFFETRKLWIFSSCFAIFFFLLQFHFYLISCAFHAGRFIFILCGLTKRAHGKHTHPRKRIPFGWLSIKLVTKCMEKMTTTTEVADENWISGKWLWKWTKIFVNESIVDCGRTEKTDVEMVKMSSVLC